MTLVGQTIHGYRFLEGIAVGGFSEVYKAHRLETGQEVAIKRINSDKVTDGKATERFKIEAGVITQLNNPHIPPVYDNWHDKNGHFMVMKWMPNGSLRRHIHAGGMRDLPTIIKWVEQIGSALQTTHDAGLIHRDVKPDNIMLDEAHNAYLADFGLAKDTTRDQPLTQIGWKLGSQAYSSPEQISNDGEVTPQSDIFAFGVTIFETLTATHPFIDGSADNIRWMVKALRDPMPLAHFIYPEIPTEIDDVLQKATQKDPADRYQSVKEMVTAFQQFDAPVELSTASDEPLSPSIPVEVPDASSPKKGIFGRLFGRS
jgi:eukaryotic-like serine/threonine-protein kinase